MEYLFFGCLEKWNTPEYGMCGLITVFSFTPAGIWMLISAGAILLIKYLRKER
jgi:hypothetical protein